MNTQGIPDKATPYTFSFACSDETTDIVPSDMIGIDIPITFRATQIRWGLRARGQSSQFVLSKNYVPFQTLNISNLDDNKGVLPGTGFSQGDKLTVSCITAGAGNKGLKIYLVGYI
jgi:hypothetical protein